MASDSAHVFISTYISIFVESTTFLAVVRPQWRSSGFRPTGSVDFCGGPSGSNGLDYLKANGSQTMHPMHHETRKDFHGFPPIIMENSENNGACSISSGCISNIHFIFH